MIIDDEETTRKLIAKKVLIRERGSAVAHTNVARATYSLQSYRGITVVYDAELVYCIIIIKENKTF